MYLGYAVENLTNDGYLQKNGLMGGGRIAQMDSALASHPVAPGSIPGIPQKNLMKNCQCC